MEDTEKIICCPACGKEMKKIYIEDFNFNIDICLDGCGGIFFDNRELEKFDHHKENIDTINSIISDKVFCKTDSNAIRTCPVCEIPLTKMGAADGGIQIDVCNLCGGKFLDSGELQKIINHNSNVDTQTEINKLMQKVYAEAIAEDEQNFIDVNAKSSKVRQVFENIAKKYLV